MWLTSLWHVQHLVVVQWSAVICASLAAACFDVRLRRIPNPLAGGVWFGGLIWAFWVAGPAGLADSLAAAVMLAAPYVVLFLFAGGGAGDAKLMGALGAWLGMINGAVVLVAVAVSGVVLALLVALRRGQLRGVLSTVALTTAGLLLKATGGRSSRQFVVYRPPQPADERKIPYGPAILAGVCLAALGVAIWRS